MNKSVLVFVVGQYLPEMRDVAGREPQRVQFGELGVRRHPGQGRLQPREGFGQHAHPGSLPRVSRVPLHVLALLQRHTFGRRFPGRCLPLLPRGRVAGARPLAVGALLRALVGVFPGRAELQDSVQELVVDIAKRPGGHDGLSPLGPDSEHGELRDTRPEDAFMRRAVRKEGREEQRLYLHGGRGVTACWEETLMLVPREILGILMVLTSVSGPCL